MHTTQSMNPVHRYHNKKDQLEKTHEINIFRRIKHTREEDNNKEPSWSSSSAEATPRDQNQHYLKSI